MAVTAAPESVELVWPHQRRMVRSLSLKEKIMSMKKQDRELQDEELAAVSGGFRIGWDINTQKVSSPSGGGGGGGGGGGLVPFSWNIQRNTTS
jgi:hypothetical protein